MVPEKMKDAMLAQVPMKRIGQAEEVAEAAAFLAGQEYLTGQTPPLMAEHHSFNERSLIENHYHPSTKGEYICLQIKAVVTGYGNSPTNTPEEFWNSLHEAKNWNQAHYKILCLKFQSLMLVNPKISHSIDICKDQNRRWILTILYAIYAAMEAIENSGWTMEEAGH